MQRVTSGWEMLKQSWLVLRRDRELMMFPVISSAACFIVLLTFALPLIGVEAVRDHLVQTKGGRVSVEASNVLAWIVGFAFYFANYFVIVFFNTALASCALLRFRGGNPTVRYGINVAIQRLPQIVSWALLAATVGTILRVIEDRAKFIGQIVAGMLGLVWTVATYLVVPVLAAEGLGPVDAVKRSVALLSKGWGAGLTGGVGLGLAGFLLALPAILLLIAAIAAGMAGSLAIAAVLFAVMLIYAIAQSIVVSTLRQIFITALYVYTAEGNVPGGFSNVVIEGAFARKEAWRSL